MGTLLPRCADPRPADAARGHTGSQSEEELAGLVTRDAMIGVAQL